MSSFPCPFPLRVCHTSRSVVKYHVASWFAQAERERNLSTRNTKTDVRSVAIITYVDHDKTTLVNQLLWQSDVPRANQEVVDRIMDSNDIGRERGITTPSKNMAVDYDGVKVSITDTPGHTDLGGRVKRVLKMVNGTVLVVDVSEGTMS